MKKKQQKYVPISKTIYITQAMKKSLYLLLLLLSSCSYQTRFANLIKRHPDLLSKIDTVFIRDTITVYDTVKIAPDSTHAHLNENFGSATIATKDSGVVVKIKETIDKNGKKGFDIDVNKKGQTIIITKKFVITKSIVITKKFNITKEVNWYNDKWFYISIILLIIIIAFIILKLAK